MLTHKDEMVNENKEGVSLAEEGNYAFFMESTSIEYETQRKCDLKQVGDLLDNKGYGIAMRKSLWLTRIRKKFERCFFICLFRFTISYCFKYSYSQITSKWKNSRFEKEMVGRTAWWWSMHGKNK